MRTSMQFCLPLISSMLQKDLVFDLMIYVRLCMHMQIHLFVCVATCKENLSAIFFIFRTTREMAGEPPPYETKKDKKLIICAITAAGRKLSTMTNHVLSNKTVVLYSLQALLSLKILVNHEKCFCTVSKFPLTQHCSLYPFL